MILAPTTLYGNSTSSNFLWFQFRAFGNLAMCKPWPPGGWLKGTDVSRTPVGEVNKKRRKKKEEDREEIEE